MSAQAVRRGKEIVLDPDWLLVLARHVKLKSGFNLLSYKPRVCKRRVLVRLRARECSELAEYLEVLDEDPSEGEELKKAFSIRVSRFFRNQELFWLLKERILPEVLARKAPGRALLVSAGCAEGEEPYGLALILTHYLGLAPLSRKARIVGIEVEEAALARARSGVYDEERISGLPPELRDNYFIRRGREYQLQEALREGVEFVAHDLREGLPLKGIDLLLCRNVLIYYSREEKRRILAGLRRSMADEGYLVLGKTEVLLGSQRSGFVGVDLKERIYRKAGE